MNNYMQNQNGGINTLIQKESEKLGINPKGMDVLGGKPYINHTGLLEIAKRIGMAGIKVEPVHRATKEEPWAEYKATVAMKDGSFYEDYGYGSRDSIKMSSLHNADFINMTTITRAKNRALRGATGMGLVSAEEIMGQPTASNETKLDQIEAPKNSISEEDRMSELKELIKQAGRTQKNLLGYFKKDKMSDLTHDDIDVAIEMLSSHLSNKEKAEESTTA